MQAILLFIDNHIFRHKIKAYCNWLEDRENPWRCVECGAPTTYTSPKLYCTDHWIAWWSEGLPPEEAKMIEQEVREVIAEAEAKE